MHRLARPTYPAGALWFNHFSTRQDDPRATADVPSSASASSGSAISTPSRACPAASSSSVCTVVRRRFGFGCGSSSGSSESLLDSSEDDAISMGSSSLLALDFLAARLLVRALAAARCFAPVLAAMVLRSQRSVMF